MIRKRVKVRRGLPAGAIAALRFGRTFGAFGPGFGPWTPESIQAARAAWKDDRTRQAALADQARRRGLGPCWAEIAFGRNGTNGLLRTIADLEAVEEAFAAERTAAAAALEINLRPEVLE